MAVGEYQTSTCVESTAGTPSFGAYCENPFSSAARAHTESERLPSITASASQRAARAHEETEEFAVDPRVGLEARQLHVQMAIATGIDHRRIGGNGAVYH